MLTMWPQSPKCGRQSRVMRRSPVTLTPKTVASSSSLDSSNGARPSASPALLTRMSRPPRRSTASATKRLQLAGSVTSSPSAISVSSRSTRRAPPATRTPAAASAAAVARPMPDEGPVTIARLPLRSRSATTPTLGMRRAPRPAQLESLRRGRMAEEEEIGKAWRLEVREVATRQLPVGAGERFRLLGELERAPVRGPLEATRQRRARCERRELEGEEQQQGLRQRARIGHPRAEHRPEDRNREDSTGHREQRQLHHVPLAPMPQLVRDDDLHLRRLGRLQQRVEDDDATRAADAGDVGIHLRRAAAGVGDEHLSHRDAGTLRE